MISNHKNTSVFSLSMLQHVIDYIETNLLSELTPASIASHFYISESTLSSLFKVVCDMTIMEYIRNRRLTLATEELNHSNTPIIELAYKYGYETPEAFTKAFSRFHGFPPSFIRRGFPVSKSFLPLEIPLDKICLTFKWKDEEMTKSFFHSSVETQHMGSGKKFFDILYKDMKVRCMFYGNCPGDDTDEFLYKNTDMVQIDNLVVPVQTLEFYYNNAEKDTEYYKMVENLSTILIPMKVSRLPISAAPVARRPFLWLF